ncbi:GGDEF domain-containing protein [Fervidobacterium sp.]
MNDKCKSVFIIDIDTNILDVIYDELKLLRFVRDNKLISIVEPNSLTRFIKFLSDLKKNKIEANWEVNFLVDNEILELTLTGIKVSSEDYLLIFAQTFMELHEMYDELLKINNEQINYVREIIKNYSKEIQDRKATQENEKKFIVLMEELTELNNELANVQRELVKKTLELEEANRKLEELAIKDPLTGLLNRRAFKEILYREYAKAKRFGIKLTIVFMDLNNFKIINDTLGHQYGDKLLIDFSKIMLGNTRENVDYVFRFGGDEFLLLLVGSGKEEAEKVMERINENLRKRSGIVSVAHGIVEVNTEDNLDVDRLINEADFLMYERKRKMKQK